MVHTFRQFPGRSFVAVPFFGSVVILASRIEQLNKQFGSQLLVSEEVMQAVKTCPAAVTCFGYVALKGWHKPVSVYKLA